MEKTVKIFKMLFPYGIFLILVFFLVPILILYQKDEDMMSRLIFAALMMLNPGAVFVSALIFGAKHGYHWYFVIMVAVLFLLFMLFLRSFSVAACLVIYAVAAMIGLYFGRNIKDNMDEMYL